jgi:hypothetical protein
MQVFRDGKEIKNATVIYSSVSGQPETVQIDGVHYDAKVFEFKDSEPKKKTRVGNVLRKK